MADAAQIPGPATTPRLAWVDATRGYSVAAVVLFHVILWNVLSADEVDGVADGVWGLVNTVLDSVRMPVLVAVSGLVLARQVRAGLRTATTGYRAALNYYLYVVWLVVYFLFFAVFSQAYLRHRVDGTDVLAQLVVPDTTLWYVYALAVYIVVLSLLHRAPRVPVLVVAVLVSTVAHALRVYDVPGVADQFWPKVPEMFVFFVLGVYGAGLLRSLAERADAVLLLVTAAAAGALTVLNRLVDGPLADSAFFVVRCAAFVAVSVVAVALAVRWGPARRLGVALGQRTLGVYVLHPLLIGVGLVAARTWGGDALDDLLADRATALLYPIVVTVVVIAVAMGIQALLVRTPLAFLFAMPEPLRARFGRGDRVSATPTAPAPERSTHA